MTLHLYKIIEQPYNKEFPEDLRIKLKTKLLQLICKFDCLDMVWKMPTISFDLKGKSAGCCLLDSGHIRFNPVLFIENEEYFLNEVVGHELCHYIARQEYGLAIKPHGKEWQHLMKTIGLEPKTTHTLSVASCVKSFDYKCGCGIILKLSIRRHNKIKKGIRYSCKKCNQILKPT